IADRDGVYGMVRAHVKAKELGIHLVCGTQLTVAPPEARLAPSPVTIPHVGLVCPDGRAEPARLHRGHGPGWGADTDDLPPAVSVTGRRGRTRRAKPRQAMLELERAPAAAPSRIVLLAIDRTGWANLVRLVTAGRRRCDKGESLVSWSEICERAA